MNKGLMVSVSLLWMAVSNDLMFVLMLLLSRLLRSFAFDAWMTRFLVCAVCGIIMLPNVYIFRIIA